MPWSIRTLTWLALATSSAPGTCCGEPPPPPVHAVTPTRARPHRTNFSAFIARTFLYGETQTTQTVRPDAAALAKFTCHALGCEPGPLTIGALMRGICPGACWV